MIEKLFDEAREILCGIVIRNEEDDDDDGISSEEKSI